MGAELSLKDQIAYIESILQYDTKINEILNPFISTTNSVLLKSIRGSLLKLEKIEQQS